MSARPKTPSKSLSYRRLHDVCGAADDPLAGSRVIASPRVSKIPKIVEQLMPRTARKRSLVSSSSRRRHVGRLALAPPALACRRLPLRAESSPLRWRAGNFAQALLLRCCASVGLRAARTCKSAGPLTLSFSAAGSVDQIERHIAYTGRAHERRHLGAAIFGISR